VGIGIAFQVVVIVVPHFHAGQGPAIPTNRSLGRSRGAQAVVGFRLQVREALPVQPNLRWHHGQDGAEHVDGAADTCWHNIQCLHRPW
jgi:hypothetical protein